MTILVHEGQDTRGDPKAMPQPVTVDVTPVFGDGGICEIDAGDGPSHSFVHGGIINLHGNSAFTVTWELQPGNSAGLAFDTSNPIWSSQDGCPSEPCNDLQITVVSCTADTLVTTITPLDPPNAVHVSLGWANGNRFDPIVINH
jgi:hypothetical protein